MHEPAPIPPAVARRHFGKTLLAALLGSLVLSNPVTAGARPDLVDYLQERFGLSERKVRGALGALLVFARERLLKDDFDTLTRRIPNAERILQDVKQQGIVTGPLDNVGEYEATLSNLGIGQPLASQFAPAVLDYLTAVGHVPERDILASALD
jgi:hypothetical protein